MYRLKFSLILIFVLGLSVKVFAENPRPLRALLIAGGCCHDYANQQRVLREGIQARANVRVDVYWTDNSTTSPVFPLYGKLNWAEEYDVIIHDECGSSVDDPALVNRIIQVHKRLPAVHLHCAMHSFRTGGNEWFEHLGLQSSGHGPQQPIDIIFHGNDHPITRGLKNWTTVNEELYNNVKLFGAKPLAIGKQAIPGPNPRIDEAVVAWTNETQGAKSFSTTIGHNTATVEDARYLDLVARGLLWACDQLNDEYLIPYTGEQTTIFIDKDKYKAPGDDDLGAVPPDATLVKVTASSTQNGHPPYHAVDGKVSTRWCADGDSYPQSITIEFEKPQPVQEVQIRWEFEDRQYHARIEGETSESTWLKLYDDKVNGNQTIRLSESAAVKKLRITSEKAFGGGWCSIKEIVPIGETIRTIWPAEMNNKGAFTPLRGDPFENAGNTIPKIVPLSPEQEAEILREVQVPDGFKATVFAAPPAVNYPVFVASSVDGTLFVSSDGNGSLGRDPSRGRIIRLRDLDGDGRADETKIFCEIDAPRGLLWDRDRLFVMHPPNLSVFFDHDNDGVADEQRTIVKNLAFGYEDRPADHTTNGLSIGVDGWIYIAGGDFGFINALGSDGTQLTHRGGGVIRVRPDGTQLQLYSTGTRNILEVAISPEMEMFARDNTNDGGGWDVRLHHFTGQEDHGYPRLYKNFNDECIQPLADYGGGSGCGAVYVAEPGFGDWGDAPFTADWGTGALYRHQVARSGASYKETEAPRPFVRLTRPTDADIDGNSRLYCASWKGATFNWN
ncbi:MAG: discoidin domain-containing protein, partial [Rubripirellula sp.]|nr:discoidin domain-containing protein [Rubripirellula sp.]